MLEYCEPDTKEPIINIEECTLLGSVVELDEVQRIALAAKNIFAMGDLMYLRQHLNGDEKRFERFLYECGLGFREIRKLIKIASQFVVVLEQKNKFNPLITDTLTTKFFYNDFPDKINLRSRILHLSGKISHNIRLGSDTISLLKSKFGSVFIRDLVDLYAMCNFDKLMFQRFLLNGGIVESDINKILEKLENFTGNHNRCPIIKFSDKPLIDQQFHIPKFNEGVEEPSVVDSDAPTTDIITIDDIGRNTNENATENPFGDSSNHSSMDTLNCFNETSSINIASSDSRISRLNKKFFEKLNESFIQEDRYNKLINEKLKKNKQNKQQIDERENIPVDEEHEEVADIKSINSIPPLDEEIGRGEIDETFSFIKNMVNFTFNF